jgi:hypothetical protein
LGAGGGHPAPVVLTAEHLVTHVRRRCVRLLDVTDDDDLALGDHLPVLGPCVVRGALAAPAQRLDLQGVHPVGELDQPCRAREQAGTEIGEDAEREDVDLQLVGDPGQLLDLHRGVELHLVADQVVDTGAVCERVHDVVPEVELLRDLDGVEGKPEAAGQGRGAGAVVTGEDASHPSAGRVVVVHLQRERRLAAVHGAR